MARRNQAGNHPGLGAFLGSSIGTIPGALLRSAAMSSLGSALGGAIGGYYGADDRHRKGGALGGGVGGLLFPVGAAVGGYLWGHADPKRNPAAGDVVLALLGTAALGASGWALYRAAKNKPLLPGKEPAVSPAASIQVDVQAANGGLILSGPPLEQIDPTTYRLSTTLPAEVIVSLDAGQFAGWSVQGGKYDRRVDHSLYFTMNKAGAIGFDVAHSTPAGDLIETRFELLVEG